MNRFKQKGLNREFFSIHKMKFSKFYRAQVCLSFLLISVRFVIKSIIVYSDLYVYLGTEGYLDGLLAINLVFSKVCGIDCE